MKSIAAVSILTALSVLLTATSFTWRKRWAWLCSDHSFKSE
jgi:hypothetical protein